MNGHVGRGHSQPRYVRARTIRPVLVALLAAATLLLPVAAQAAAHYPNSMASTGDSITRAYNTGTFPYSDNPSGSWSTGTNATVNSHYNRLRVLNSAIQGRNFNDARSGAKMIDLNGQMTTVVGRNVDYVTVLMGGNDVCTPSPETMTSEPSFRSQFTTAMNTITAGSPGAQIYVLSIPNVKLLWSNLKGNATARFVWSLFRVCQSMLRNPLSMTAADIARREAVLERERAFNQALREVCATYAQCRYDNDAVFNYAFTTADISTRDYFHPSLTGQKNLAAGTWAAGFWGAP